jgi:hypothetical protein
MPHDDHLLVGKGIHAAIHEPKRHAADMMANMSAAMFGEDDPDTRFYRWVAESVSNGNLREAATKRGLNVEEGPGFIHRLRDAFLANDTERIQD